MTVAATVGVLAIIRLRETSPPDDVAHALLAGGITALEVTLPTPDSLATIARWRDRDGLMVGAGTVRTAADAAAAIDAGAAFLVTPTIDDGVLDLAAERQVPVYCGAATPTEIETAARHPATTAVKVFPAGALGGTGYISALKDPLPDIALLPTGGVGPAQAQAYAALGCVGVGVGGSLVNEELVAGADWAALTGLARELVGAWRAGGGQ